MTEFLTFNLPKQKEMADAIVKLTVEYPRELDVLIDEDGDGLVRGEAMVGQVAHVQVADRRTGDADGAQ